MGIERTVTLWYLHRQILLNELALLEAQLVQMRATSYLEATQPEANEATQPEVNKGTSPLPAECVEVEEQYKRVQERLDNLGPCPRPMMG